MLDILTPQIIQVMYEKSPEACIVILLIVGVTQVGIPTVNLFKKLTESMEALNSEVVKLNVGLENVTKAVDAHKDATETKFNTINTKVAIIEYSLNDLRQNLLNSGTTHQSGGTQHGSHNHP